MRPGSGAETTSMNSKAYEAAIKAHNEATAKFHAVRDAYRARQVGDAEFLAARKEYRAATAQFDAAFARCTQWSASSYR